MKVDINTLTSEQKKLANIGYEFYLTETKKLSMREPSVKTISFLDFKINQVKNNFDKRVSAFLSKYPKREQDTFAQKLFEAKAVLAGGESIYIKWKAELMQATEKQVAEKIIEKNNDFTLKYVELENQKDIDILKLEKEKALLSE